MPIPTCTYRIQLHEKFTFNDLAAIVDYLHQLGITTIYASPITKAFKGSQHGYDVVDPTRLNPEIGTEQQLEALAGTLKKKNMTWLQDIVPNHMAYSTQNPWLYDVLERGKESPHYSFFDIRPNPVEWLGERLMAPFLGSTLTDCLHKGELTLRFADRGFVIRYFDEAYPVTSRLYPWICNVTGDCPEALSVLLDELMKSAGASLPEWDAAKKKWLQEIDSDPRLSSFIGRRLQFFNDRINLLENLLDGQPYVLTHHRLAASVINYRRFFTVNSLICLRMEEEAVFSAYHKEIYSWYNRGWIQGLRIDHIDGLAAPGHYIDRLRRLFGPDCYLVAEKILARNESLPAGWDLEGTTGYEFLLLAGQVLTDAGGSRQLLDFYTRQIIDLPPYSELVTQKKYNFLRQQMGGELNNLMDLLTASSLLGAAGYEFHRLKEALAALLASFPVYRLYPDEGEWSPSDRQVIAAAFTRAKKIEPDLRPELLFLEGIFTGSAGGVGEAGMGVESAFEEKDRQRKTFLMRLMQFTGPLAAKGVEDTSFYVYNPDIAHNEVGDTPAIAGISPAAFHQKMQDRQATLPHSLNATTTHDTKRGEDSRIRLNLLSARPQEWIDAVTEWRQLNRSLVKDIGGRLSPSSNDEYLIYQALLGGFPEDGVVTDSFRERFAGYLTKALREAKTETNYDSPDEAYEQACQSFSTRLLAPGSAFLESFGLFASTVIRASVAYSLAQVLIKLTAPGIPDIYQGAECWETSFVDPDNRRPVDFCLRMELLQQIKAAEKKGDAAALNLALDHPERGGIKLFTIYRSLIYRNAHPAVFSEGAYLPVLTDAPVLAYIRRHEGDWALVLVPLVGWDNDGMEIFALPLPPEAPGVWKNVFTGDMHHANLAGAAVGSGAGDSGVDGSGAVSAGSAGYAGLTLEWREGWSRFPVALLTGRNS